MTRFIDDHRGRFGVAPICDVLGWPSSTYYAYKTRPPSDRALRDAYLLDRIRQAGEDNFQVFGARKMWIQLRREQGVDTPAASATAGGRRPSARDFGGWLAGLPAVEGHFVVEATTGWRFVVEELARAGFSAHLAEPAETSAARGPKKRAKTDGTDARHLRELVEAQRLWESWVPPGHLLDLRETVRLRQPLMETITEWQQRPHAVLPHHGVANDTPRRVAVRRFGLRPRWRPPPAMSCSVRPWHSPPRPWWHSR
jgi:hypothetical protein